MSGLGTFLMRTPEEKLDLISHIVPILQHVLEKVDATNVHHFLSSLIFQILMTGAPAHPAGLSVNFFV